MVLMVASILIMLAVAWSQYRNGLFSSVAMLVKVLLAGVVAFGFWEPIADFLDPVFQNNMLAGSEDMIALTVLFALTLFLLRLATNWLAPEMIEEHGYIQHFGAAAVGVLTGYFVAGFLVCAMQTLPLEEGFMGFEPRSASEPAWRNIFPSDRVWLVLMRHAGAYPFSGKEDPAAAGDAPLDRFLTFDRAATFELRYLRYRRFGDNRPAQVYVGEFDRELGKKAK